METGTALVLLLVGLAFSAFSSGVETALTALPFARVASLAKKGGPAVRWAWRIGTNFFGERLNDGNDERN